ncbi:sigma factor-like helix-turn-helix DNA-binding protein [Streptomyces sp. NPDC048416]|uniref:sigma factor-like helix-turn-helix DNA-binding protein n=1 Tax=Streptomyces sp. NPDC048416 TaxID=3365546 RepID=UPI00371D2396
MTQSTAGTGETDAMSPLPTPKERRRLREAKSLSEAQVAAAVGVTPATVRSWETGRTAPRGRRRAIYARLLATFEAEAKAAAGDRPGAGGGPRTEWTERSADGSRSKTGLPREGSGLKTNRSADGSSSPKTNRSADGSSPRTDHPRAAVRGPKNDRPGEGDGALTGRPAEGNEPPTDRPREDDEPLTTRPAKGKKQPTARPGERNEPLTDRPAVDDEPPTDRPGDGDGEGGGEPKTGRQGAPARVQTASSAKPPAKPHVVHTRPKPAADGASPQPSRPGGRTAKPSASPHPRADHPAPAPHSEAAPTGPTSPTGPAAPTAFTVPEPAREALKSGTLSDAGALTRGGVGVLPERQRPREGGQQADAPAGKPRAGGAPRSGAGPATLTSPAPDAPDAPRPAPHPEPDPVQHSAPQPAVREGLTPAEAFDALYAATAPALAQQAYLLTGRTRLARESVQRAFHLAWENWPEVATDRDPAGWVRTAAYEYAMAPWHRFRRTHKHPDRPPVESERRALLDALLELPPVYRRTVLLYDGLGLDLPETAAETQASTPAAASRVLHARSALVDRVPAAAGAKNPQALSSVLRDRITDLALAGPPSCVTALPSAPVVRTGSERRRRFWTRAAIAFTALIVGATAFTVVTVPHHHVRPVPLGERVGGVPLTSGPQQLTAEDIELRDKLRKEPARGPYRLVVDIR